MFEKQVIETIEKYNLIEENDRIVLGVSGGPDSLAMLDFLNKFKDDKIKFSIVVAHINHGLRENAKIDEEFVKDFCSKRQIECFVLHSDVKQIAQTNKRGLEETGRDVRYEFFNEILEKTKANKIAIAHNANDNVETVIMNILRGSGLSGLKGIEARSGIYIRPLIECSRKLIENYCNEQKLNPRHDESNDVNTYTRNKIRNVAIPYIKEEINPNIIETITRLSLIARDDINYLDSQTKLAYKNICIEEKNLDKQVYNEQKEAKIILDLKLFNKEDKAMQKRIILYAINRLFGNTKGIEKIHIEDIIKLCNNNIGNKFLTPNKKTKIVIKNKKIYVEAIK